MAKHTVIPSLACPGETCTARLRPLSASGPADRRSSKAGRPSSADQTPRRAVQPEAVPARLLT